MSLRDHRKGAFPLELYGEIDAVISSLQTDGAEVDTIAIQNGKVCRAYMVCTKEGCNCLRNWWVEVRESDLGGEFHYMQMHY
jgi:hypothetical protein